MTMEGSNDSLSILTASMSGSPAVLLTPGRTRNIAQDMEALRLSRQDNPYLQQVMASRESLIESHGDEYESDDTILMSQEFGSTALDFVEDDPLTLKEVHEHMIRSPPPISCWPHGIWQSFSKKDTVRRRPLKVTFVTVSLPALSRHHYLWTTTFTARREPPTQRVEQIEGAARVRAAVAAGAAAAGAAGPARRAPRAPRAPRARRQRALGAGPRQVNIA